MKKETMKAVFCTGYGPPEVLKIVETVKPVPKANEVMIKIMATAVNSGDVRVRGLAIPAFMSIIMRVVLGFTRPRNPILGVVLSGVVEAVGGKVQSFKLGDEVYAATGFKFGAYAEYITLRESAAIALKPVNATFEEAASIPFGGTSALYFLEKAGIGAKPGQKVMVYGAKGAVGTSAVQIAKYHKAHVTATCSNDGIEMLKSLGCDKVLDYTREDFSGHVEKYDIIFDAFGAKSKKFFAGMLEKNGTFVSLEGWDVASESKAQLDFLKQLFESNAYKAVIDRTYPLEEIQEAHRYVDSWTKKGNVVIKVAD